MIMIMIINKIILKENVENNSSQPYLANDLAIIIPTIVLRSCYYSLMKPIQSFVSYCSTILIWLTSSPVDTQMLQGRFTSHFKCIFLQVMHATKRLVFPLRERSLGPPANQSFLG